MPRDATTILTSPRLINRHFKGRQLANAWKFAKLWFEVAAFPRSGST
jgi:hypothetical protein